MPTDSKEGAFQIQIDGVPQGTWVIRNRGAWKRPGLVTEPFMTKKRSYEYLSSFEHRFLADHLHHTALYLVAYLSHLIDGQTFRIGERPVVAAEPWNEGAFLAAAHGDQELGTLREFERQLLWLCVREIDADLVHDCQHFGVNTRAGLCSGRDSVRFGRIGKVVEERCRHLGAASIMNAGEDIGLHQRVLPGLIAYTFTLAAASFTS